MRGRSFIYTVMALVTIIVWGVTFVSTKVLIKNGLSPIEIFIIRFMIAYLCTLAFSHNKLWADSRKDELMMLAAGVSGGSLYFIAENSALEITFASNVSLIICCAPIFTIVLGHIVFRDRIKTSVVVGSIIAFIGVAVVIFNSAGQYGTNPKGDVLTLLAALSWAIYCLILKKLSYRYNNMFITRKVFAYGVITAILFYILYPSPKYLITTNVESIIANLLFLGIVASFLCYLMWNAAVRHLGAERTSNYIYLVPLVTIIASTIILAEPYTLVMGIGTVLVIGGVIMSTKK